MPISPTITHLDTCFPNYLWDHCDRDDEFLLSIPVDKTIRADDLLQEALDYIKEYGVKIPNEIDTSSPAFQQALLYELRGAEPSWWHVEPSEESEIWAHFRIYWS